MSLRAFHAGVSLKPAKILIFCLRLTALRTWLMQTVCAFLAIRQPDKSIAIQCLVSGAIKLISPMLVLML